MRTIYGLLMFLMISLVARVAWADGLLYQLPKDGAWATYDVVISMKIEGRVVHIGGTWRIASVGKVSEGDKPCRWIEFQKAMKIESHVFPPYTEHEAWKLLFPEKYLAKGESPMEHLVRAWNQVGKDKPDKITTPMLGRSTLLLTIFSGPWKDAKKLEPVDVSSKLGTLPCEGVQGTLEITLKPGIKEKTTLNNRLHPKSPFGVVTGHWMVDRSGPEADDPPATVDIKLTDFGDNASSQIPSDK